MNKNVALDTFYEITLKLSATKTCTSNIMFTELVGLQVEIERKIKDEGDETLQKALDGSLPFPRWKLAFLKISLQNLGPLQILDEGDEDGLEDELDGDDAHSQMLREMLLQRKEEQQMEISNEVDKYFANPFENPRNKNFNLLDWWKRNQSIYPILSKVAKDIFAIPSSTVDSENAFSLGKKIVDPFRSSLTPKMVEVLVCTHDWLRVYKFNLYKEPMDEEIAFYMKLEEIQASKSIHSGGVYIEVYVKYTPRVTGIVSNGEV
ncbi:unnamed protein product [Prunus armeniaca]